jgi:hypothetical protein
MEGALGAASSRCNAEASSHPSSGSESSLKCAELYKELERMELSLVEERGHSERLERAYREKLEEQHRLHAQDVAALEEMISEVLTENQRLASRVAALEVADSLEGTAQPPLASGECLGKSKPVGSDCLSSDRGCASTCSLLSASDEPLRTPRTEAYNPQSCGPSQMEALHPLLWKRPLSVGVGSDTESDRFSDRTTVESDIRLFSGVAASVASEVPVVQCAE